MPSDQTEPQALPREESFFARYSCSLAFGCVILAAIYEFVMKPWFHARFGSTLSPSFLESRVVLGGAITLLAALLLFLAWKQRPAQKTFSWICLVLALVAVDKAIVQFGSAVAWNRFESTWKFGEPLAELSLGLPPGSGESDVRSSAHGSSIELEPRLPKQPDGLGNCFGQREHTTWFLYRRFTIEDRLGYLIDDRDGGQGLYEVSQHRTSSPNHWAGIGFTRLQPEGGDWSLHGGH